jgi:hypothetical protein
MARRRLVPAFFALVLAGTSVCAQSADERLVRDFFPSSLYDDTVDSDTYAELQHSSYVSISVGDSRRLVAAYANGFAGVVRLIDPANPPKLLDEVNPGGMVGANVTVATRRITPDPDEEVVVTFTSLRGDLISWLMEATPDSLRLIGPSHTVGSDVFSKVVNALFTDLDGDGFSEVISRGTVVDQETGEAEWELFSFKEDGSFQTTKLALFQPVYRQDGKPTTEKVAFAAQPGESVLVVVNGPEGSTPATAGSIKLNGQMVFTPADFQRRQRLVRMPVRLQQTNEMEVELSSAPGSGIFVMLE